MAIVVVPSKSQVNLYPSASAISDPFLALYQWHHTGNSITTLIPHTFSFVVSPQNQHEHGIYLTTEIQSYTKASKGHTGIKAPGSGRDHTLKYATR